MAWEATSGIPERQVITNVEGSVLMGTNLDYITVRGFRSIKNAEKLELRAKNLLIGANGSGKSNFVGVFALLHTLRAARLEDHIQRKGGAEALLHFGSKRTKAIEIEISFNESVNGYRVRLAATDDDRFSIEGEKCWYWEQPKYPSPLTEHLLSRGGEAGISQPQQRIVAWVQKRLDTWRIYHFQDTSDSSPMKKTADVDDNRYFRPDGSNLAAYLLLLRDKHPDEYQLIRRTIQRVTPFLDDFQLEPLRRNKDKIKLEWRHRSSDRYFDAASLSDGTLRFICLATLFLQPVESRPSVILIDEPELGLHPYAVKMLASLIQAAANDTQVIVSTQSPLLLDDFAPEDVLVADLVDGATSIRRLVPEELEEWLEDYTLGQLWEKNQFGGKPSRG